MAYNKDMETPSDNERFQEVIAALDQLPPGVDDDLRNQLLDELDALEYEAGRRLLAGPDPDED